MRDVGEARDVVEGQRLVGEQAGDHQRQGGVLGAGNRDRAVQAVAADDADAVHEGRPRCHENRPKPPGPAVAHWRAGLSQDWGRSKESGRRDQGLPEPVAPSRSRGAGSPFPALAAALRRFRLARSAWRRGGPRGARVRRSSEVSRWGGRRSSRAPSICWCCRTGLNCRPLPYQGSALPLSYGSVCAQSGRAYLP